MSTTVADPNAIDLRPPVWDRVLRFCRRQPLGTFGLVLVLIIAVTGIFAEFLAPYNPTANDFAAMTESPSWEHLLGTDQFGRDLLSRIVFGARTALIVGLTSAFVGGTLGLVLGVGSAFFGGTIDMLMQRLFDVVMAFPLIIMALAIVSIFGTGVHNVIIAITIPLIPRCARVGSLGGAGDPRSALCRRRPRLRFQRGPHYPQAHGAKRDGAVPDHGDRVRRPGQPRRGLAVLPRTGRAGAGAGLGPDAAGRGRGIRLHRPLDRHFPGRGDHAFSAGDQSVW